ncbi:MAG: multicopper oxidase domain-containing protein [Chitinophagales bacterium]
MMKRGFFILTLLITNKLFCQNPLFIPPVLSGTEFDLQVQNGTVEFFPGVTTPTYGINGNILAPTLIMNKWDWVTLNVTNNLTGSGNSTTMHWHGFHLPAMADGGPHQIIEQGTTWSPSFQVLNNASTYWYHPHGDGKTDLQVARGLAGIIIVRDSMEAELNLPRTYGTDDFPIIIQTKAFDILYQIAIATEEDTFVCVNATPKAFLEAPAQVIRYRILNGSSMRVFNLGFTDDKTFFLIGTDGGLLNAPVALSRLLLAPGERAEILVDMQGLESETVYLKSFNSELLNGFYGAATVTGMMGGEIAGYELNPLNGYDFDILQLNIVEQTTDAVLDIPSTLIENYPFTEYDAFREFILQPDDMMDADAHVMGPFNINGDKFSMDVINETVYINTKEKWRVSNNTGIAHPFHIHDVQFTIDNINGDVAPLHLQGNKDVVLIPPMEYAEVIMEFKDFADHEIPYMYHCHMLHHEDDGMMGSFTVIDTSLNIDDENINPFNVYPNPVLNTCTIQIPDEIHVYGMVLLNTLGEKIENLSDKGDNSYTIKMNHLDSGPYVLQILTEEKMLSKVIMKL